MANYPVQWFASNMQGAPSLGDTTEGALTAFLKAVLVTGFGSLTVNSIVWDATESAAKATISGGHSYLRDSIINVSGATPTAYNGDHRIKKITTTEVWFELDGGTDPGSAASGTLSMMVAPLRGWTLTHESGDGKVAIYRPTDITNSGNVSLRIDNTAWSGWTHATYPWYLAKVQLVEDVVDINTYTLIYDHRWPCTKRSSDGRWDFIGDNQLFYFIPAFGYQNRQHVFCFGYIKSVRPGDRYHAILHHYGSANPPASSSWGWINSGVTSYGDTFASFDATGQMVLARAYHQLSGTATCWFKGLFGRMGTGLSIPNGPDNAVYINPTQVAILETGNHLRGYLPGLLSPYGSITSYDRLNMRDLPEIPNKVIRCLHTNYATDTVTAPTMVAFDLTGPWR